MQERNLLALAKGATLNHYVVDKVLGQGGFGIVYMARHSHLDELVVIKEFLPVELAGRDGSTVAPHSTSKQSIYDDCLHRFLVEGKTLVKLKNHNVVRCRDLFKANGTAYLVMDFEDGCPLDELVQGLEKQGVRYSESQLLHFLIPLAEGLSYVHQQGVLHRDIKPANIFIRRSDSSPVILDFGAAKQNYAQESQSRAPFTEFYAPIEQIDGDLSEKAKPTIDIHAFGGLIYRVVTGTIGPKAERRISAVARGKADPLEPATKLAKDNYSPKLLVLVDECLACLAEERPQSMKEVVNRLHALQQGSDTAHLGKKTSKTTKTDCRELDDLIIMAGADGIISCDEMAMVLRKAETLNIDKLTAQQYVVEKALQQQWVIEKNQADDVAKEGGSEKDQERIDEVPLSNFSDDKKNAVDSIIAPAKTETNFVWALIFALICLGGVSMFVMNVDVESYLGEEEVSNAYALSILSSPKDANVRILNTAKKFKNGMKLKPGNYQVEVSKLGYETQTLSITIDDFDRTKFFELVEINASYKLNITSSPKNATVRILNRTTKFTNGMKLKPGKYQIEVSKEGYETIKEWLIIKNYDRTKFFDLVPIRKTYKLNLTSSPANATIRILNIKPKFKNGMKLTSGKYHIEVSYEGYVTQKQWITIDDSAYKKHFSLAESDCISGNCQNGYGTKKFNNGLYEGNWLNGERSGKGTFAWQVGDVYEGGWLNDERTGEGRYTWPSGGVYEGGWVKGERTGEGTYTWDDGASTTGGYLNDERHGRHAYIDENGKRRIIYYKNGVEQ